MRALVLSGGASKIGFQFGVYSELKNKNFDYYIGNSCGAIAVAGLAQGKGDDFLARILNLSNSDIYEGNVSIWRAIKQICLGKNYLLDMSPLRKLLQEFVKKEDFIKPAYFVFKDKITGDFITTCTDNLATTEEIIDAIMSSSAIPLAMSGVKDRYYDGGIEQVCPISVAINLQVDEIVIINCFNRVSKACTDSNSLLNLAGWVLLDAMPETIAKNSINPFLMMNQLVKDASNGQKTIMVEGSKKTIRYFDYDLYEPTIDLGDSFDFDKKSMIKRFVHGSHIALLKQ